jgi:hypothetical protein
MRACIKEIKRTVGGMRNEKRLEKSCFQPSLISVTHECSSALNGQRKFIEDARDVKGKSRKGRILSTGVVGLQRCGARTPANTRRVNVATGAQLQRPRARLQSDV